MKPHQITEISLELTVGTIAGKWWGPTNVRPILCLHGWADNAGSFDELIPLLPRNISYLAIDLPGHGLSSNIGKGLLYSKKNYIYLVQLIKNHYKWEKVSIMGHSFGGVIGMLYAGFFPEEVDMLINIDLVILDAFNPKTFIKKKRRIFETLLITDERLHRKVEPPSYSYEKLLEMMQNSYVASINLKAAEILLKRGSKKSDKSQYQHYVSRDARLRMFDNWIMTFDMWSAIYENIVNIPLCYIQSGKPFGYKQDNEFAMSALKDKPNFYHHVVEAGHHVHLTHPESVSNIISDFINNLFCVKSKL